MDPNEYFSGHNLKNAWQRLAFIMIKDYRWLEWIDLRLAPCAMLSEYSEGTLYMQGK